MITNYEIRKINNEEILYIYINDSYEFFINKKKDSLNNIILDFIEKNKIKFLGTTIAVIAGGLLVCNVNLNNIDTSNKVHEESFVKIEESLSEVPSLNDEMIKEEINVVEDNSEGNEIKKQDVIVSDATIKNETTNKVVEETKNEVVKEESENEGVKVEVKEENTDVVTTPSYKEPVTIFRSNGTVITLELEEYIVNVVCSEMPASFNEEALKAQSVLARTYAKKAIKEGKVLTDTVSTQVYKDNNELKKLWGNDFDKYYNKVRNAVQKTNNEVLKYNGDYIEALYHSTSNGFTEDSINVWGNDFPYLKGVESSLDKNVKNYEVTTYYSFLKLSSLLGLDLNENSNVIILERNKSNRVSKVSINDKVYTGIELRTLLGLRSADFNFEITNDGFNISTKGYGHGVGLSQYGSNELAKQGYSYKNILNHYYPGTTLTY